MLWEKSFSDHYGSRQGPDVQCSVIRPYRVIGYIVFRAKQLFSLELGTTRTFSPLKQKNVFVLFLFIYLFFFAIFACNAFILLCSGYGNRMSKTVFYRISTLPIPDKFPTDNVAGQLVNN
jgi:hypothetical protein